MSRFIKITLVGVAALAVLSLGYWLSREENGSENIPEPAGSNVIGGSLTGGNGVPEESLENSRSIFPGKTLGFFVGTNEVLGVNENGHVLLFIDNKTETLSSSSFASVTKAQFSFDGKRILLQMGSLNSPFYKVFDVDKKTWKDLPFMISPAWAPKTHEIAYIEKKSSGHSINTLNADSPAPRGKVLLRANIEDGVLFWPRTSQIILSDKGTAYAASSAWRIDKDKRTWLPMVLDRSSLSLKWNKDGSNALVLTGSGRGGKLSLTNDRGEALREFSILTLPEKCSFESDSMICAIPEDRRKLETSFLPDDYLKGSFFTRDSFLEINLDSGETKSLNWTGEVDAINLQAQGKQLFFVNRLDGKLYSIKR